MSLFYPFEKSYWLHRVCEANFLKLMHLVPDLSLLGASVTARVHDKPPLHLRLLDRSPYTLTLELTHDFEGGFGTSAEPAVRIRVSLDAKTCEVLSDHCRPAVVLALKDCATPSAVLDYKWTLNYFLARWLDHCVSSDYRFGAAQVAQEECCAI